MNIQGNWSLIRPSLAAMRVAAAAPPPPSTVCDDCGERCAILRCKTCAHDGDGHMLLCGNCDRLLHPLAHVHQREVWSSGYYKSIPAQVEFEEDGKVAYVGTCSRFTLTITNHTITCTVSAYFLVDFQFHRRKTFRCFAKQVRRLRGDRHVHRCSGGQCATTVHKTR